VHIAGHLDVLDGDLLVDLLRAQALSAKSLEILVIVVGRAQDRLLEDRRIGGVAPQRILVDQSLELPTGDERALQVIQPGADAGLTSDLSFALTLVASVVLMR
jgi:hypothetical protein